MTQPQSAGEDIKKSLVWRQYVAGLAGTLLALSCGTMLAWTSPVLPLLKKFGARPTLDDNEGALVGSLVTLGACLGAIPGGFLADYFGRKRVLLYSAVPLFVSWFILLWSVTASYFYVGRTLAGVVIGVVSVATPMYMNEIADTRVRGTLGTFFQLQIVFGILLMYIFALFDEVFFMTLACSVLPLLFLAIFPWMPESPLWLASKGRADESKAALHWLRGTCCHDDHELSPIENQSSTTQEETLTKEVIAPVWSDPAGRRGLTISLMLMLIQQMSGVTSVVLYTNNIYMMSGTSTDPYTASLITAIVQVLATFLATMLIDKAGRRLLLVLSTGLVTSSHGCLGFFIYLTTDRGVQLPGLSLLPVFALGTFFLVFNIGIGPVPWLMSAELVRPEHRAAVTSAAATLTWGLGFITSRYFHAMTELIGVGQTFGVFAFLMMLGTIYILIFVPETQGKTNEEVVARLGKSNRRNREL